MRFNFYPCWHNIFIEPRFCTRGIRKKWSWVTTSKNNDFIDVSIRTSTKALSHTLFTWHIKELNFSPRRWRVGWSTTSPVQSAQNEGVSCPSSLWRSWPAGRRTYFLRRAAAPFLLLQCQSSQNTTCEQNYALI